MPTLNHFDYFTDIEKAFIRRRGKHLMIGPLDWSLIESWQKRGVPLRIVLQAIDEVFDSFEQRNEDKTSVRSLKYCGDAVDRRFADWSRAQVGKSESIKESLAEESVFPERAIKSHIEERLNKFQLIEPGIPESIIEGLEVVRGRLAKLKTSANVSGETELDRLDDEINELILSGKEVLINTRLRHAIDAKLAEYGISVEGPAADRVVCEAIRDEYGIPRLSLFEL